MVEPRFRSVERRNRIVWHNQGGSHHTNCKLGPDSCESGHKHEPEKWTLTRSRATECRTHTSTTPLEDEAGHPPAASKEIANNVG